jgi:DNA-binding NtrC family response regulator
LMCAAVAYATSGGLGKARLLHGFESRVMNEMLGAARAGPLRILLVEDHADTLEMLGLVLRLDGHEVLAAGGFEAALRAADGGEFDLLMADIQLGDGDGWVLLERLRRMRPGLYGIAMTGHGMIEHEQKSIAAGYRAHLTKPIDFGRLREAIRACADGGA